jgi:hypothetical protein
MKLLKLIFKIVPWILVLFAGIFFYFSDNTQLLSALTHPKVSETETHQVVIEKIEALGKLELVKYQFKDVLEYTQKLRFFPDSRIILIASGEAVGCIDLSQMLEEDILVSGDTLMLNLPAPELCYYKLDHQKSKVYDSKFTLLNRVDTLINAAFRKAERQIKQSAIQSGILQETQKNARMMLVPMLEAMSGKKVILGFKLEGQKINFEQ